MARQSLRNSFPPGKRLLLVVPVVLALLVVFLLVRTRSGPPLNEERESARVLRVIRVEKSDFVARAEGFGTAEPARVWQAVAEVRGRVVEVHPRLQAGAMLKEGDILLKIDPVEYELEIAATEATRAELKANLEELRGQEENISRSLDIERRSMDLARRSFERKKRVLEQKGMSPYEVEQEERNVLLQEQRLRDLENLFNLLPARKEALHAKLAASESRLDQARLDLARTVIRAPFACRLGAVDIEPHQYLAKGQMLFEVHGIGAAEIEAQVPAGHLRHLIGLQDDSHFRKVQYRDAMEKLSRLEARVRIPGPDWDVVWPARVDRLREQADPETRAFNVVVVVEDPYEKVIAGKRPPLTRGLFCRVELTAPPRPESIVVPRSAIHDGRVFVVDNESRLKPVQVETVFVQGDLALVESGLAGGEILVVSDPSPAVTGMLVSPVFDDMLRKRLHDDAAGELERP